MALPKRLQTTNLAPAEFIKIAKDLRERAAEYETKELAQFKAEICVYSCIRVLHIPLSRKNIINLARNYVEEYFGQNTLDVTGATPLPKNCKSVQLNVTFQQKCSE